MAGYQDQGVKGFSFTNKPQSISCSPELYFEPESREQVLKIIDEARRKNKRVKVIGDRHSFSGIACTDGYMINLNNINKLIYVDQQTKRVKVEAGIYMSDFNDLLAANGLALTMQGGVSDVTLAGVISTATHGSGIRYGAISTYVHEMELMCASGDVITVSRDRDEETFRAAAVGLGALGVILTVTMQCEPAYRLEELKYPTKTEEILHNLNDYLHESNNFMFHWFPHTEGSVVWQVKRTTKSIEVPKTGFFSVFVGKYLLDFLLWISTFFTFLIPYVNRFYYKFYFSVPTSRVDRCDRVQNYLSHMEDVLAHSMEWTVPRNKAAEVLREVDTWIKKSGFPAHFPVDVRFGQKDDLFLSPAYGRDVCYLNFAMFKPYGKVSYQQYWEAITDIMVKADGRPHWAKDHNLTADYFRKTYPKWDDFCRVRERLDLQGMFLNRYLDDIFSTKSS